MFDVKGSVDFSYLQSKADVSSTKSIVTDIVILDLLLLNYFCYLNWTCLLMKTTNRQQMGIHVQTPKTSNMR